MKKENEVDELISKWTETTQDVMLDVYNKLKLNDSNLNMIDMFKELGIEPEFLNYNIEEEEFNTL